MSFKYFAKLKFTAGVILMVINTWIWINGLFINRDSGMDIIWALPLFYAGSFLVLGWFKTSGERKTTKPQRLKFILSILLINYLVLYLVYAVSDLIYWEAIDLLAIPGILLPVLLGIFITGFVLSWNQPLYAGILFVLWYLLMLFGQIRYSEILHRGPYILLGIPILIHGIMYMCFYFRFNHGIFKVSQG
jgi:hypothetical protein